MKIVRSSDSTSTGGYVTRHLQWFGAAYRVPRRGSRIRQSWSSSSPGCAQPPYPPPRPPQPSLLQPRPRRCRTHLRPHSVLRARRTGEAHSARHGTRCESRRVERCQHTQRRTVSGRAPPYPRPSS
eukprot:675448-Prymnesium_polylepis.2